MLGLTAQQCTAARKLAALENDGPGPAQRTGSADNPPATTAAHARPTPNTPADTRARQPAGRRAAHLQARTGAESRQSPLRVTHANDAAVSNATTHAPRRSPHVRSLASRAPRSHSFSKQTAVDTGYAAAVDVTDHEGGAPPADTPAPSAATAAVVATAAPPEAGAASGSARSEVMASAPKAC